MTGSKVERAGVLRGLWLARELPFPANMGDRIYSGNLAKALATAGADLTFAGFLAEDEPGLPGLPGDWPIRWQAISGRPRKQLWALFSTMPLVAASYATSEYRRQVRILLRRHWDFVIVDQYGLGWVLEIVEATTRQLERPVLVHVAHDHEASVCESLYRGFKGSATKRLVLWQNFLKTRAFERQLVSRVDLVTAITEEDATKFAFDAPKTHAVVLKPGFSGTVSSRTTITGKTPRRVVLVGSFRWIAKQENLRQFVKVADPIFAERGIEFVVVGAMPTDFADELGETTKATRLLGFVERLDQVLESARMAIVPEDIGGGFKLKFLDYIFGRVPVATLTHATAGIPVEIRRAMLCRESHAELAMSVADRIDNLAELNVMQEDAIRGAVSLFQWTDRGRDLLCAIQRLHGAKTSKSSLS